MGGKKKIYFGLLFLATILILGSVGVTGFFHNDEPRLAPFNATVTITNEPPVIIFVSNPGIVNPIEGGTVSVPVSFIAEDSNGALDLNSIGGMRFDGPQPNFYVRHDTVCAQVACSTCNSNQANYSCGIGMEYFLDPTVNVPVDLWNIIANVTDSANQLAINDTERFTYNELKAIVHEVGIFWTAIGLGVGDIDQIADGAPPMALNNRGNVDLLINISAHNLTGQSIPTEAIPSERFTASPNTGGLAECNDPVSATRLSVDGDPDVNIAGALIPYGDVGFDEEQLYYCIPETLNALGLSDPLGYKTELLDRWVVII